MSNNIVYIFFSILLSACFVVVSAARSSTKGLIPLGPTPFVGAWLIPDDRSEQITVHLVVLAGEADHEGTEGLAHYVEHLAWLNATAADGHDFPRHSNAFTSRRLTGYWLAGGAADLDRMVSTLAKVLSPLSLPEDFMIEERNIVLREYDYRVKENPYAPILDELDRRLHGTDPLHRSVLGKPKDIAGFMPDAARELHARTHVPGKAVLIIRGNVDAKTADAAIRRAFGEAASIAVPVSLPPLSYATQPAGRHVEELVVGNLPRDELFYRKVVKLDRPAELSALAAESGLLTAILDSRLPGGLARPLRFDAFIAERFEIDIEPLDGSHMMLSFTATPDRGVSLEKLLRAFEEALAASASGGIPKETIERIRRRQLDGIEGSESPADIISRDAFRRLGMWQRPVDVSAMLTETANVDHTRLNELLLALSVPGRAAIALASPPR